MSKITLRGFVGCIAINGHALEVVESPTGRVIVQHSRYGWRMPATKSFASVSDYEAWLLNFGDLCAVQVLDTALAALKVEGFPCLT